MAEDGRFDTIHPIGNDGIQTPNLDRLVAKKTAAHTPGETSGAVCMPSRAMTIYGKRLLRLYSDPRYRAVRNILEAMLLKERDRWEDNLINRFAQMFWEE